jgi:hypothetical protein
VYCRWQRLQQGEAGQHPAGFLAGLPLVSCYQVASIRVLVLEAVADRPGCCDVW